MALYRLLPNADQLHRPNWQRSTHKDVCHVSAESEAEARQLAVSAFGIATRRDPHVDIPACPWRLAAFVDCVEVAELGTPIPQGMVTTPERPVPFLPIDG
ncbi:MAG TPA: hypothetical protein VM639_22905 [Dongiaceae bacterium]|nr:hypothetical protein [Dongiaceae bacterium]